MATAEDHDGEHSADRDGGKADGSGPGRDEDHPNGENQEKRTDEFVKILHDASLQCLVGK